MFYFNYIQLCNSIGKSPSTVAEDMGFQRSVVTRWSKGTSPRAATLQKIADYFGVPVETLKRDNAPESAKKSPAVSGEGGMSEQDKELYSIWMTADENERRDLLEMARILKNRRA